MSRPSPTRIRRPGSAPIVGSVEWRAVQWRAVHWRAVAAVLAAVSLAAGCAGGSDEAGLAVTEAVDSVDAVGGGSSTTDDGGSGGVGGGDSDQDGTETDPDEGLAGGIRTPLPVERTTILPDSFLALTEGDHRLVRVDRETGAILEQLGGWGQDVDGPESEGPVQVLSSIEPTESGTIWLDDCCEPAIGSTYRLGPGETFNPVTGFEDLVRFDGFGPQVSPDGSLVALVLGSFGLTVIGADGTSVFGPDAMSGVLEAVATRPGDELGALPLAWLSNDVLVVSLVVDETDAIRFIDVSGPQPELVGAAIDTPDIVIDAEVRNDGHLVIGTIDAADDASDDAPVVGRVIDPDSGEQIAVFDLPPGTIEFDYEPTATFLVTVTADGTVRWTGRGETEEIGSGFVAVSW